MRKKDDMQVNVAGLRRNIKNLAHNYSDAQVKVREATSNDPWGPSAAIMAEIADLTYNVVAFSEIMQMIWKRLNDHGKNWRHVYKALILLEYLIKTGTEKVAQQCKENIFAIQTLREFVYYEEGKDQGTHVREKAKQLVNLLKDDERLKNERIKALKAKERFAQHPSGFGSDGYIDGPSHRDMPPGWQEEKPMSDLELVRPQTAGEEELQLKLAMAMSREEADQEEAKRRSDDVRLQLALSQSEQDFKEQQTVRHGKKEEPQSHLLDLLDISLGATSISSPPLGAAGGIGGPDPWVTPARAASQLSDPWSGTSSPQIDPWQPAAGMRSNTASVPLGAVAANTSTNGDAWALRTQSPSIASGSSTEGWLQSNGSAMNGNTNVGTASVAADPWLGKSAMSSLAAAQPSLTTLTGNTNIDPWLTDAPKPTQPIAEKSLSLEDPWAPKTTAGLDDPWKCLETGRTKKISPDLDEFDVISNRNKTGDLISNDLLIGPNNNNATETITTNGKKPLKTPQAFLGENSSLVNLDNLIKPVVSQTQPGNAAYNPFSDTVIPPKTNLFQQQQPTVPSINQLKQQQPFAMSMNQDPWAPVANPNAVSQQVKENPFLLESDGLITSTRYSTLTPSSSLQLINPGTYATSIINKHNHVYGNNYNNSNKDNQNIYNRSSDSDDDVFSTSHIPFHFLNSEDINNNSSNNNNNNNNNNNINQFLRSTNIYESSEWSNLMLNSTYTDTNLQYQQLIRNSNDVTAKAIKSTNINNNNNNNTNNNKNVKNSCLYPCLKNSPGFNDIFDNISISGNEEPYASHSRFDSSIENGLNEMRGGSLFSYGFYDANVARNDFSISANTNNGNCSNNNNNNNNNNVGWIKPDAASSNPFLS